MGERNEIGGALRRLDGGKARHAEPVALGGAAAFDERDIRFRDPAYLDDPEIVDYLSTLGGRLAQANPAARQDFEFFAMRDHTINAFALPGGFVGVHSGLLSAAETESELASVLAHEIGHVSQRHIARMLGQQQQLQMPVLAALAAAILLGRARPGPATGAAVPAPARPLPAPP